MGYDLMRWPWVAGTTKLKVPAAARANHAKYFLTRYFGIDENKTTSGWYESATTYSNPRPIQSLPNSAKSLTWIHK